jgi:hypothetical protein
MLVLCSNLGRYVCKVFKDRILNILDYFAHSIDTRLRVPEGTSIY